MAGCISLAAAEKAETKPINMELGMTTLSKDNMGWSLTYFHLDFHVATRFTDKPSCTNNQNQVALGKAKTGSWCFILRDAAGRLAREKIRQIVWRRLRRGMAGELGVKLMGGV